MSSIVAYSQVVNAVLPKESWDEAYFSLLSLKAHIQSLPGWQRFDLWAHDGEQGEVRILAVTNWDHPVQLEEWLKNGMTVDAILRSVEPSPKSIEVDLFEEIA